MGATTHLALPWALFSANLRAFDASPLGLSVFLLVSIRLGDRRFRAACNRLPKAQNVNTDELAG